MYKPWTNNSTGKARMNKIKEDKNGLLGFENSSVCQFLKFSGVCKIG